MPAKIRVGIVGATITPGGSGWGANAHVPALHHLPDFELKAVCTAHEETALASKEQFGAELAFQDKRLNVAYQKLRISLPKDGRLALRSEGRAWIDRRDKRCAPDLDGGTAALLDANQCRLDETAARAAALEKRMH